MPRTSVKTKPASKKIVVGKSKGVIGKPKFSKKMLSLVVVFFALLGGALLYRAYALQNTVTYSGSLKPTNPVATYSVATGPGKLTATLTDNSKDLTLTLKDSAGNTIGGVSNSGRKTASLTRDVVAGNYTAVVSYYKAVTTRKAFKLVISYPAQPSAAPTAVITSPAGSETVSGTVDFAAKASDDKAVTKVEFYVNNGLVGSDSTSPYSVAWNTTTYPNDVANLSVVAYDAENQTATASASVTVSNDTSTPPPSGGTSSCPLPAYPDASCTGVPAGTTLTAYTGPTTIETANTVIDGKTINSCLSIKVPGVVIKNSKISCTGGYVVYSQDGAYTGTPLTIQDSEIDCRNTGGTAFGDANITALRVNVHGCENGFDINANITIMDSYIHDMFNSSEAHTDGIQLAGHLVVDHYVDGSINVTVMHNTIYGMGSDGSFGTSSLISNQRGDVNVLIQDNLLAGGAYSLYCVQDATGVNYRVINNHFSTRFKSTVGYYGATTGCGDEINSGNVYHESGQPIILE